MEAFEGVLKKAPGLAWLAFVLTLILSHEEGHKLLQAIGIYGIAWLLLYFGSRLDDLLFDPLFGIEKGAWSRFARLLPGVRGLDTYRRKATKKLWRHMGNASHLQHTEGIYESSKSLFEGTQYWENRVKVNLELSKAFRSLVLPLFLLAVYALADLEWGCVDEMLEPRWLSWLQCWWYPFIAAIACLVLYLWLRVCHVKALYRLVRESTFLKLPAASERMASYRTAVPTRHLSLRGTQGQTGPPERPTFLLLAEDEFLVRGSRQRLTLR